MFRCLISILLIRSKLGPRIIPHFREIITLCVAVLREGTTGRQHARSSSSNYNLDSPTAVGDAQSILLGLLSSIPSFWGTAELEQVVFLYLDHCATMTGLPSALMSSLMKSVAKRAPSKVLLPAMVKLWPSLKTSGQTVRLIFSSHYLHINLCGLYRIVLSHILTCWQGHSRMRLVQ